MSVNGFLAGIKAAARGATTIEPSQYMAARKVICCTHCDGTMFFATRASFHTATDSLLHLEWASKEVHVLICGECTHLDYFYDAPEQIEIPG